jgi:undecaprenyl diphosphate synthase
MIIPSAILPAFPSHVAIIMDGNGRWATARNEPRGAGHAAGARAVYRTVEAARAMGVRVLTLYAFSADNWKRPAGEVDGLMRIFAQYLRGEVARCRDHGIRLTVLGRRDRLGVTLQRAIDTAECDTAAGAALDLRIAIDYSARDAIVRAAALAGTGLRVGCRADFAELLARAMHARRAAPDVDLLIRTGGERRLSDFMLWECAYAELVFTDRPWPEFCRLDLESAIAEYQARDRRFGAAPADSRAFDPQSA